jgi:hypothetical protein
MHEWLEQARDRIAGSVGDEPAAYDLSTENVDRLLELARVAAHESGERTNAPLVSYLVGLARGRHPDRELADLVGEVAGKPPV